MRVKTKLKNWAPWAKSWQQRWKSDPSRFFIPKTLLSKHNKSNRDTALLQDTKLCTRRTEIQAPCKKVSTARLSLCGAESLVKCKVMRIVSFWDTQESTFHMTAASCFCGRKQFIHYNILPWKLKWSCVQTRSGVEVKTRVFPFFWKWAACFGFSSKKLKQNQLLEKCDSELWRCSIPRAGDQNAGCSSEEEPC